MKQSLLLSFIFLLKSYLLYSQTYTIGTTWHYHESNLSGLNGKSYTLNIVADTIINGKTCQKIIGGKTCAGLPPEGAAYCYHEANKVYEYDFKSKSFKLLYDWNAKINDIVTSYAITKDGAQPITYQIDSIGYWMLNNVPTKVMKVKYSATNKWQFASYYIIEKIGANAYFFPQLLSCSPVQWGSIRCFEQPGKQPIKFVSYACSDAVKVGSEDIIPSRAILIYPTPSVGEVNVQVEESISHDYSIEIFDSLGRLIFNKKHITGERFTIPTNDWRTGFYTLKLIDKNNNIGFKKIIKTQN
jgi:hypothetical protein